MGRPLAPADAAWLGLDRPEHLMVVTAVLTLDGRVGLADLRALVDERVVARFPRFRAVVTEPGWPRRPRWTPDPEYDVGRQVVEHPHPLDQAGVQQLAAAQLSTPLDRSRPLWLITLIQGQDGRSTVLVRAHHALADGLALISVLLGLVDSPPPGDAGRPSRTAAPVGERRRPGVVRLVGSAGRVLLSAARVTGRPNPLRAKASVGREVAWTEPLDLAAVKQAAHASGLSVNDILLGAVAGGVRAALLAAGRPVADVECLVPVDLRQGRPPGPDLGNRFGVVFVTLPVGCADRAERLALVHTAADAAKGSAIAPASYGLLSLVGLVPRWSQGLAALVLSRIAHCIVTNVPGPRERLALGGAPLRSVVFWVPHIGTIPLGVSVVSYAGTVTVGVALTTSATRGWRVGAAELAEAIEAELGLGAGAATD